MPLINYLLCNRAYLLSHSVDNLSAEWSALCRRCCGLLARLGDVYLLINNGGPSVKVEPCPTRPIFHCASPKLSNVSLRSSVIDILSCLSPSVKSQFNTCSSPPVCCSVWISIIFLWLTDRVDDAGACPSAATDQWERVFHMCRQGHR